MSTQSKPDIKDSRRFVLANTIPELLEFDDRIVIAGTTISYDNKNSTANCIGFTHEAALDLAAQILEWARKKIRKEKPYQGNA
jgi:predicted subunit of tRNA(5-methylaminomethyl-2-thiouridylate) methyltransferase